MTFTDLYHVGVVVAGFDSAAEEFQELLGVRWAAPRTSSLTLSTASGAADYEFRYTYSRGRPGMPLIELIEARDGTPWALPDGATAELHHIGFWADPLADLARALGDAGARIEASVRRPDDSVKVFSYHQMSHGPRIELVDAKMRDATYGWLAEGGTE